MTVCDENRGAASGETIVGLYEPAVPVSVVEHQPDLDALLVIDDASTSPSTAQTRTILPLG